MIGYIQEKVRFGGQMLGERKSWSSSYYEVSWYCEKSNKTKASLRKY